MTCPICDLVYCDHSPAERGQTHEEMMADCYGLTEEEFREGKNPLASAEKKPDEKPKKKSHTNKGKARAKKP